MNGKKRYTKEDVTFHSDRHSGYRPMICIKAHKFPSVWDVLKHFKMSEKDAEKVLQSIFESAQERFFEDIMEVIHDIYGPRAKFYTAGNGGWLYVENGPYERFSEWDAIELMKWRRLELWCKREIEFLCSWEYIKEEIDYYIDFGFISIEEDDEEDGE